MYPQYPAGPPVPQGDLPEAPRSIKSAVRLMYAGAIVSAIGAVLLDVLVLVASGSGRHILSGSTTPARGTGGFVAIITLLGAIEIALWLWMAYAVKRGMGWARMVSSVLFAINVLFTVLSLGRGGIPGIVILAIGAAAVWQLWRPDSTAFFAARGAG